MINLSKIESLLKMSFDVKETLRVLRQNPVIPMSWGMNSLVNVENKGLMFRVQGHHHTGWVLITLDWSDTYDVHLLNRQYNVVKSFNMVYWDDLTNLIDEHVERVPEYR